MIKIEVTETDINMMELVTSSSASPIPEDPKSASISQSVGKELHPDDFEIYEHPENLHGNAREIEKIAIRGTEMKVRTRLTREAIIFTIPLFIIILNQIFHDDVTGSSSIDISFSFGIAVCLMTVAYFGHFFVILSGVWDCRHLPNKYLYRIYSLNCKENEWAGMTFTFAALKFKYHPITSISELSAVMGGTAHTMLVVTSSYTYAITCCAVVAQSFEAGHKWTIDTFLVMIGCFGLTLVGSFELDQLSKPMIRFHYLGAILCLCAWIAFFIQSIKIGIATKFDYVFGIVICSIMCCIMIIGFGLWQYYQKIALNFAKNKDAIRTGMNKQDIAKRVTQLTFQNVGSEAAFLAVPAFSVAGWLLQYGYCTKINC